MESARWKRHLPVLTRGSAKNKNQANVDRMHQIFGGFELGRPDTLGS